MKKTPQSSYEVLTTDNQFVIVMHEPCILRIPTSKVIKRFLVVLLRLFFSKSGKQYFTFQQIADIVGLKDRRDVDNYYREFKQKGSDFLLYLSRKVNFSKYVVPIQQIVTENPFLSITELFMFFQNKYPRVRMTYATFVKYLSLTNSYIVLKALHRCINKKENSFEHNLLFSYLLKNIDNHVVKKKIMDAEILNTSNDSKTWKPNIKLSTKNKGYLIKFLIGAGLSYESISFITSYSRSYINKLANNIHDFGDLILSSIANYSGQICVDEKYVKLNGVFRYIFSAVDAISGIPLFVMQFSEKTAISWQLFFTCFKKHYGTPTLIVSDGCHALKKGRLEVFPRVKHQYCKFHKMKNMISKLYDKEKDLKLISRMTTKLKQVFSRDTVGGRRKALLEFEKMLSKGTLTYFLQHIKSEWIHLTKSLTSNAAERWNRELKNLFSGKYGLKSPKTIDMLVHCLWFKEIVMRGKNHLSPKSAIFTVKLKEVCQENLNFNKLEQIFQKKCA